MRKNAPKRWNPFNSAIQGDGKCQTEVVSVCERFLEQVTPLLGDNFDFLQLKKLDAMQNKEIKLAPSKYCLYL